MMSRSPSHLSLAITSAIFTVALGTDALMNTSSSIMATTFESAWFAIAYGAHMGFHPLIGLQALFFEVWILIAVCLMAIGRWKARKLQKEKSNGR